MTFSLQKNPLPIYSDDSRGLKVLSLSARREALPLIRTWRMDFSYAVNWTFQAAIVYDLHKAREHKAQHS